MARETYQRIVIGYHGCDAAVVERVLAGKARLSLSTNAYDWLGEGIYFWEHGPQRAYEWAIEQARLQAAKVRNPSVLAARIDLGVCLDLLDTANTRLLGRWFAKFRRFAQLKGVQLPQNRDAAGSRRGDKLLRYRDCAVIDYTLRSMSGAEGIRYQTVRGVFVEGKPAFPGSKIALKSHIQIAVKDPACIIKLFEPTPSV
ncbi:MAG TPA: hypothetical protein VK731_08065 [Candidatus Cybelea sp.]|jgi:hypothetical protein|nr:hypothetical protein [Candidatus Cybelea sp.]